MIDTLNQTAQAADQGNFQAKEQFWKMYDYLQASVVASQTNNDLTALQKLRLELPAQRLSLYLQMTSEETRAKGLETSSSLEEPKAVNPFATAVGTFLDKAAATLQRQ